MSKDINCTFMMSGTYYMNERSVLAARRKAMENLPLPEDRDYLDDSLVVDDLDECMAANGWEYEEVETLSKMSAETLTAMIDERIKKGLEIVPGDPSTTSRLKEFLLDYYDIEYDGSQENTVQATKHAVLQENKPQPLQASSYTKKPCYIVVSTDYEAGTDAYAFDSEEAAMKSVHEDVETVKKNLTNSGYEFDAVTKPAGEIEITALDGNIYYGWQIIPSTIMVRAE